MAERGMSYWLGHTAREMRERHGITLLDIATRAGVAESVVSAFEGGKGWRRKTDAIVLAYATELAVEPSDIWRRAVEASSQ